LPLYEYECPQCGTFERMQKFSDPLLKTCPTCGKPVEKLPSAPAIQFKGSGWYVTDYARKSSGREGGGKDSSSGDGGKKDTGSGGDAGTKDSGGSKDSSSATKSSGKD
jgi:putative FmdB family regulatory protein